MKYKKFDWIFFDLDGTLADSIPASYKIHMDFLAKFGILDDNKEEFERLNGPSLPEIITILKAKYKLVENENYLLGLYKNEILKAYKNYIKPFENLDNLLRELKERQYKLSLVTSADREIAIEFIKKQMLDKYFENYVFGNEVQYAKPNPMIYTLALKRANVSSDLVVVVEDSYNGVQAAKATGAFVIGVTNNQSKEVLLKAGADITILALKDILLVLPVFVESFF